MLNLQGALGIEALFELFIMERSGIIKASAESPTRRVTPKLLVKKPNSYDCSRLLGYYYECLRT